ncbi:uncharacterized protein EV422DRAFT_572370 [Fimicolochytrium jonesii]|uniref:uncharacterized protein n=1 Tax=Fimicolochytrium jonesii TaxID=1396493 RepID=UPI0022FE3818|nr:uncharacterized protein EV422DRAFT_572370 [Fimicolochytrium jonesii]KAI8815893.1 hypothetical protein EV422DRAFT_572370 [Fimicolochytrium jonesii]
MADHLHPKPTTLPTDPPPTHPNHEEEEGEEPTLTESHTTHPAVDKDYPQNRKQVTSTDLGNNASSDDDDGPKWDSFDEEEQAQWRKEAEEYHQLSDEEKKRLHDEHAEKLRVAAAGWPDPRTIKWGPPFD